MLLATLPVPATRLLNSILLGADLENARAEFDRERAQVLEWLEQQCSFFSGRQGIRRFRKLAVSLVQAG